VKADTRCDDVRVELSARLDDEVDLRTAALVDAHLAECDACRAYESSLRAVKRAVALQAAPEVRDLAPAVMARVRYESLKRHGERRTLLRTAVAAALVTTLVLSGGLVQWRDAPNDVALASEITRAVRSAAADITSYHATFDVIERGWHPRIEQRRLTAEVWFEAPERLRMEITDHTDYPGRTWPTNDATLIATPRAWWLQETASCPTPALPGCEVPPHAETRALERRQPFDGSTALPTDLILPLETLAQEEGLDVVGPDLVDGRAAHHVVLQQWQARPLIDSLQIAGTWRRFTPTARVDLWLDAQTWFPLRFSVQGGNGALQVETTSLESSPTLEESLFETPAEPVPNDGGFEPGPVTGLLPTDTAGLAPYRSGTTRDGQQVTAYASGMSWFKILVDRDNAATISTFASELVDLGDRRFGYLEPSDDPLRRTIEILGARLRVRIESNLPRQRLIDIAASVPVDGRAVRRLRTQGGTMIERVEPAELRDIDYALLPSYLPPGFELSNASVTQSSRRAEQLTIYYRRPQSSTMTNEIRLIFAPGFEILPPSSENLVAIRAGDLRARWSPSRSELEWLDRDTYRAVAVPAFDLETAIRIARSLDR